MASTLLMRSGMSAVLGGRVVPASRPAARSRCNTAVRAGPLGETWYPGAEVPEYLAKANLPGTYGFDPLGLGTNPESLAWYAEAEKTNARWAMAAVAGVILLGALLSSASYDVATRILFTDAVGLPNWVTAGAEVDLPLPLPTLIGIEVILFALLELKRYEGFKKTGKSGFLNSFPFDPLGLDSPEMAEKEIRNGRLAMLAFVGFASVYAVRGVGPVEALKEHIANPGYANICTSKVGVESTLAIVAFSVAPMVLEARKAFDPEDDEFDAIPW